MSEKRRKRILVCNDDGYDTSGIRELAAALREIADVHICAPARNCSGASSALTVHESVSVTTREGLAIVDGTPVDCVKVALQSDKVLDWRPDLTVSGINHGGNLGDDTIYSGTVSAAAESVLLGVPAIAFSLACVPQENFPPTHFKEAAQVAKGLVEKLADKLIAEPKMMINVNIPDLPAGEIKGPKVCVLGKRHPQRPVREIERKDDLGLRRYVMGMNKSKENQDGDTDFEAIDAGHVSVTPLDFDMTEHARLAEITSWAKKAAAAVKKGKRESHVDTV